MGQRKWLTEKEAAIDRMEKWAAGELKPKRTSTVSITRKR